MNRNYEVPEQRGNHNGFRNGINESHGIRVPLCFIAGESVSLYNAGLPIHPTRGARDGLPTPNQGENRQEAEALLQVQRSGQLPIPLQKVPQGCKLTPDSRTGCHECRISTE